MVAYHFPPSKVSSGIQRTLKFSDYLDGHGWDASVLTVHPRAHPATSPEQLGEIAEHVRVHRAFALDTKRHLAVGGRYLRAMALPDPIVSWVLGAVPAGLRLIRRERPAAIWSTYPIATAHLIGYLLHKLTGLPWIADFRDSMTEPDYPAVPAQWRAYRGIERRAVERAAACVFTTPGALRMYRERYPDASGLARARVIPNGYDEENFAAAGEPAPIERAGPVTLVHAGVLYPSERDPSAFFEGLARLRAGGGLPARGLRVRLRATGHDELHRATAEAAGVADLVEFAPPLPYVEALREMMAVDGLLIFQAASCNHQIPAKLYEYFRAGRPILALTDEAGDTAATLREAGTGTVVPLDDAGAIAEGLSGFLAGLETADARPDPAVISRYSRRALTGELAGLLDEVAATR